MIKLFTIAFIGIALLIPLKKTQAQVRGSNLAEYQLGNIPGEEPSNQSSLYNQLNLSYRYKKLSLFTRAELYQPSFGEDIDYVRLSQYRMGYKTKIINLDVGHLYSSFGRGLLLRNYEIPSSIYEELGYRVRYGFYKDMHGISAKFKSKYVNVKLLHGEVLNVEIPPTFDENERRKDLVEGGEIDVNFKQQTLGFIFMRHHLAGNMNNYTSVYYNGNLRGVGIYGEIARRLDSLRNVTSFSNNDSFGGYMGVNYSWKRLGFSAEYKNYKNFDIGSAVNDPPTLVKEHSFKLLNRSTHTPLLFNESGYQLEVYYQFGNGNIITFNNALAENKLATNSFVFREYYLDLTAYLNPKILTKTFIDFATDPLKTETRRITGGGAVDMEHKMFSSTIDIELQYILRKSNVKEHVTNFLASYTLAKASKFSITALLEISNDPVLVEEGKTEIFYPSASFTYLFGPKNKLSMFYGRRRGGPACTSGVCYDVLDYEGLELRLNTRF
jgi:hypothetical protein